MWFRASLLVCVLSAITLSAQIRCVVFDFGGVMVDWSRRPALDFLLQTFERDEESIRPDLEAADRYVQNGGTEEQYWLNLAALEGRSLPLDWSSQLAVEKWDVFNKTPGMERVVRSLQERQLRTAMLSNVIAPQARAMHRLGFYELFDPLLLSCEIGFDKPSPQIFLYLVEQLGVQPHEILFFDDREEHVRGAQSIGIDAIRFTNLEQLLMALQERGITLPAE